MRHRTSLGGILFVIIYLDGFFAQEEGKNEIPRIIQLDEYFPDTALTFSNTIKYSTYIVTLFEDAIGIGPVNPNFKIVVSPWSMKLKDDAYITIKADTGPLTKRNTSNWSVDGTDIRIERVGDWKNSSVVLVASLYKEVKGGQRCPDDYFRCGCPVEGKKALHDLFMLEVEPLDLATLNEDVGMRRDSDSGSGENPKHNYRCIPDHLRCDRRPNCGHKCETDETHSSCKKNYNGDGDDDDDESSSWYDVQYLLTILLAGLFFILSPICIVIFLFYHRRLSAARDLERQRTLSGQQNEVYNTGPDNDSPPSYDDVHDTKNPPPEFEAVAVQPRSTYA